MKDYVTQCPNCGLAGNWEWTKDLQKGVMRHVPCGTLHSTDDVFLNYRKVYIDDATYGWKVKDE